MDFGQQALLKIVDSWVDSLVDFFLLVFLTKTAYINIHKKHKNPPQQPNIKSTTNLREGLQLPNAVVLKKHAKERKRAQTRKRAQAQKSANE